MSLQINQLVKTLLQKDSIEACSIDELRTYADRHPYFGAAQLLLAKKLQSENREQYDEQLQKTFLFFHNPLWVQQLLDDYGKAEIIPAPKKENGHAVEMAAQAVGVDIIKEEVSVTELAEDTDKQGEAVTAIKIPGPIEDKKNSDLLFEPYHTVDYFASQGIKMKEEEKPKDKLSQQLRSFTEWLKTMKRLPVTEIVKEVDPGLEKKVEQLAETSLQERDVLTETMAEVWEKQGNISKAIDIYNKLSLLEPSKSAYFAAKIEDLKKRV